MCRLTAYLGKEILLSNVVVDTDNSIIKQSAHALESKIMINGDGFGIGWYTPEISPEPALFTSILPAWSDQNLLYITAKIKSPAFFAHVRSASLGSVSQSNCHPFLYEKWMFMHNGGIGDFLAVKRHLRHLLDDDIYHWIKGETDSEHIFALFLQRAKGRDLSQLSVVADVLQETFFTILDLVKMFGKKQSSLSKFNICLTDGQRLIAARYSNSIKTKPQTLYYSLGGHFLMKNQHFHMVQTGHPHCILVASEKLTTGNDEWNIIPANHFLLVDEQLNTTLRSIPLL